MDMCQYCGLWNVLTCHFWQQPVMDCSSSKLPLAITLYIAVQQSERLHVSPRPAELVAEDGTGTQRGIPGYQLLSFGCTGRQVPRLLIVLSTFHFCC